MVVERTATEIASKSVGALMASCQVMYRQRASLISFGRASSTSSDLPLLVASDEALLADGGGRTDVFVNRIPNEASPADLPVRQPTSFQRPAQPFDEARSSPGGR